MLMRKSDLEVVRYTKMSSISDTVPNRTRVYRNDNTYTNTFMEICRIQELTIWLYTVCKSDLS